MEDKRSEFTKLRRQWMKDHEWNGFICARCGRYGKSTHLHHIQEIVYGGENVPENLIPLCSSCHRELDYYPKDYPFEQFLVTMPGVILPFSHELAMIDGAEMLSNRSWMALCASTYRAANIANAGIYLEGEGWTSGDFQYNQNQFFSKYPYSDESWRAEQLKKAYGELALMPTIKESCRA